MFASLRAVSAAASSFVLIVAALGTTPAFAAAPAAGSPAGSTASSAVAGALMGAVAGSIAVIEHPLPDFSSASSTRPEHVDLTLALPAPPDKIATADGDAAPADTLAEAVADNLSADVSDEEERCLATAVYYKSQGEPLDGQLAVAQTVINRTTSDRFPSSICGVVRQPGQFSFVHHGELPRTSLSNRAWREAVAIAAVAREKLWHSVAPRALYFHARSVSPGWGMTRVASLGHHIFYR